MDKCGSQSNSLYENVLSAKWGWLVSGVKIDALCTSYFHLYQVIAFALTLKEKEHSVYVNVYVENFLGVTRIDSNKISFDELGLAGEFHSIELRKVKFFPLVKQVKFSWRIGDPTTYILCADTINLRFVSYLEAKGVRGKLLVFEDGLGSFGSIYYRAKAKSQLEGASCFKYWLVECVRHFLTVVAMGGVQPIYLIKPRKFNRIEPVCLRRQVKELLIRLSAGKGRQFKELNGSVLLVSQPLPAVTCVSQSEYFELIYKIKSWATSQKKRFYIKLHPNDDAALSEEFSSHILDCSESLEEIAAASSDLQGGVIVGFTSTALLTCSLLFDCKVYRVDFYKLSSHDSLGHIPVLPI